MQPFQRPFIVTKDKLQKAIFGAGYPSLPVMSVDEFYDASVAAGDLPPPRSVQHLLPLKVALSQCQQIVVHLQCTAAFLNFLFDFKAMVQMVRVCITPSYGPLFILVVDVPRWSTFSRRMSADTVFCQVFVGLPTGDVPSTNDLVHAFTQSASPLNCIRLCNLIMHLLITSPILSTLGTYSLW